MREWLARMRSFGRGILRPDRLAREMDEEMRFHIEMEAERMARERAIDRVEARRQAAIAFGGLEARKEEGRDVRGLTRVSGLALDVKLAWRMLRKSPGLTVVGVLGIALGTAVGVSFFVVLSTFVYPKLPLDEGDRIVALENWDAEANNEARRSLHDFVTWREELRSVEQVAAFSLAHRLVVIGDAEQPVSMAAMTAAGFQVARVPPLLGRYLQPADEREGAPEVAVLGYDLWQARFEGNPGVLGRTILVGDTEHEIVGVMPPGFAFPKNQELWTALRLDPARVPRGEGPELFVFGRLASGATRAGADAELSALGKRAAAEFPQANAHLRPQVLPFTHPLDDIQNIRLWELAQFQLLVSLLLVAIAVNMAILTYARTATRQGEIALRTALGASRRRIVGQLFLEALLLSALGAGLGLAIAHVALREAKRVMAGMDAVGFWVNYGIQPRSVLYATALALIAASIIGGIPGLKSTGRKLTGHISRLGSGASERFGRTWTLLIVAQVAVAVAVLPTAMRVGFDQLRLFALEPRFPAHEFLAADLALAVQLRPGTDAESYRATVAARLGQLLPELERRLESEPAVAGVTIQGRRPLSRPLLEVEGVPGPAPTGTHWISGTGVAPDYFDLLGTRVLAGRGLRLSDAGEAERNVVVNAAFARALFGDKPVVGRRVRFVPRPEPGQLPEDVVPGPWSEIVGVVADLVVSGEYHGNAFPATYYAVKPGQSQSANLLVRIRNGDTNGFAPRLRRIVAALDPDLRLGAVGNLAGSFNDRLETAILAAILLVLGTVVSLSAAGIHALMSLTVTRRRREIGIRTALGAQPARLLAGIFSRAAWQLGLGGLVGVGVAVLLLDWAEDGSRMIAPIGGVLLIMLLAGLAAAIPPARRGLRIQPLEALKEE